MITEVFGVSSFITTLGMLLGLGGLTLIISHAAPVAMPGADVTSTVEKVTHVVNGQKIVLEEHVNHVGTFARIFGAGQYSEFIWALLAVAFIQVVLSFTRWGMYTVAVGGNKHGAAEAGVKVRVDRDPQLRVLLACWPASWASWRPPAPDRCNRTPRARRRRCSAPCRRR